MQVMHIAHHLYLSERKGYQLKKSTDISSASAQCAYAFVYCVQRERFAIVNV